MVLAFRLSHNNDIFAVAHKVTASQDTGPVSDGAHAQGSCEYSPVVENIYSPVVENIHLVRFSGYLQRGVSNSTALEETSVASKVDQVLELKLYIRLE